MAVTMPSGETPPLSLRLKEKLIPSPKNREVVRLNTEYNKIRQDIMDLNEETVSTRHISRLFEHIEGLIEDGYVENAWRSLSDLRELEIKMSVRSGEDELRLKDRARRIYFRSLEMRQINKQTGQEIERLLTDNGSIKESPSSENILSAAQLLYQQHINRYHRERRMHSVKVQFLAFVLSAGVFTYVLFATFPFLDMTTDVVTDGIEPSEIIAIVSMGTLGASISGLLALKRALRDQTPPDVTSVIIVLGRVLTGGAGALVVFLFQQAGFLFDISGSTSTVLALSFIAGFSERLFVSSVEQMSKKV
jgi:hypothetical protein